MTINIANGRRARVLVLGGGFAGIGAARALKESNVEVVVVDTNDYHTFQPLLYQLATGLLETSTVGHSLRDLFRDQPNAVVRQATASAVDPVGRKVHFADIPAVAYDYLVLALGAEVNFLGVPGATEHAFPLYTLADAVRLKDHVVRMWEAADRDPGLVADGALNVVVVGGGATGIETIGALAELYHEGYAKDFPGLPEDAARLTLVEAGPDLFSMFKPDIRSYTERALVTLGVEVMLGETVAFISPTRVTLKSGRTIDAHTLVWAAGLQAHPIAGSLGRPLERGRRIPVESDLSIADHPEVFAVGDIAWIVDETAENALPQLASVALQAGTQAGRNIARLMDGKETEAFAYEDKGTMATIGRGAAVVQMPGGRTIKGKSASLAWGAVHLALLSSGEDRAKAVVDWTWAGFTHDRPGRVTVSTGH